jgi:hypothetical protein
MRKFVMLSAGLLLFSGSAFAAPISLKISNKTGVVINSITATPKSGGAVIAVTSSAIAAGAEPKVTLTPAGTDCVFTMAYVLASGKTITIPDTDLCQTDVIAVQ